MSNLTGKLRGMTFPSFAQISVLLYIISCLCIVDVLWSAGSVCASDVVCGHSFPARAPALISFTAAEAQTRRRGRSASSSHRRTRSLSSNQTCFLGLFVLISEEILEEIQTRGFTISRLKDTVLSREMAEEFYKEHRDKAFFSQLVDYMCR